MVWYSLEPRILNIAIRSLYVTCQFPAAPLLHKYPNLSVLLHPYQVHASSSKTNPVGYASPTTHFDIIPVPRKGQFLSIPQGNISRVKAKLLPIIRSRLLVLTKQSLKDDWQKNLDFCQKTVDRYVCW